MMRSLTIAATCAAMFWLTGGAAKVYAAEQDSVYPHVIVCEFKGVRHFAYLDRVEADGRAIYMTPSGKAGVVPRDGTVSRVGNFAGSCAGKTLQELLANGQALFIRD